MEHENFSQFDEFEVKPFKRRTLLPLWIKVFCWFFIFMGVLAFASFTGGFFGNSAGIEFYGLNDSNNLSIKGLLLTSVLLFKAYTAYALWFEKDNAINLGKIDAVTGIIICIAMTFISPVTENGIFSFRLEVLLLIPYYMKLSKIEYSWYNKQY